MTDQPATTTSAPQEPTPTKPELAAVTEILVNGWKTNRQRLADALKQRGIIRGRIEDLQAELAKTDSAKQAATDMLTALQSDATSYGINLEAVSSAGNLLTSEPPKDTKPAAAAKPPTPQR